MLFDFKVLLLGLLQNCFGRLLVGLPDHCVAFGDLALQVLLVLLLHLFVPVLPGHELLLDLGVVSVLLCALLLFPFLELQLNSHLDILELLVRILVGVDIFIRHFLLVLTQRFELLGPHDLA